jgi:hypothetical protein
MVTLGRALGCVYIDDNPTLDNETAVLDATNFVRANIKNI